VFNMSGSEIIVILLLALVVLGPEKLPDAMRRAGKTVAELRRLGSSFQSEMHEQMDEPMREMRDTANLLRGATDFKGTARRAVTGAVTSATAGTAATAESKSLDGAAAAAPDAGATSAGSPDAKTADPSSTAPASITAARSRRSTTATNESPIERALSGGSTIESGGPDGGAATTAEASNGVATDRGVASAEARATAAGDGGRTDETGESPIERALRGGSTIDRAETGKDGITPA